MNQSKQPKFSNRPDSAGWWYDTQEERWRWCFQDAGMGLCARDGKRECHFWPVSNYKPKKGRWYGPWILPVTPHQSLP